MTKIILAAALVLAGCAHEKPAAVPASPAPIAAPIAAQADVYANPDVWLCKPGRQDACTASQDATIVAADGTFTHETFHAAKNPPIDCFYVYPTVSTEPGGNSDLIVTTA